jgi:hypothetical protein
MQNYINHSIESFGQDVVLGNAVIKSLFTHVSNGQQAD